MQELHAHLQKRFEKSKWKSGHLVYQQKQNITLKNNFHKRFTVSVDNY